MDQAYKQSGVGQMGGGSPAGEENFKRKFAPAANAGLTSDHTM